MVYRYSIGFRADSRLWRIVTEGADSENRTKSGFLKNLVLEWDRARRATARRSRPARKPESQQETIAA
jgi:hypothetical protein